MKLTTEQSDAITEVINIGVGRAAASLSQLVDERIELEVPRIQMCNLKELSDHIQAREERLDTLVSQDFGGVVNGRSLLGFSRTSGIKLAQIIGDGDTSHDDLDLDLCGILEEVGNIVLNAVLGSLANMMETTLTYSIPELHTESMIEKVIAGRLPNIDDDDERILLADAQFGVSRLKIHGSLVVVFELDGIEIVLSTIMGSKAIS